MAAKRTLGLSTFDNRLLDGLNFARLVHRMFEEIRTKPGGVERLRLLATKTEKRLVEEQIPIARYVQARYHEGRRIKIRWLSGSQPYDAVLLSSGYSVERTAIKRKVILEVTTAVHRNDHLLRELVNQGSPAFGVKGVSRDRKTKKIFPNRMSFASMKRQLTLLGRYSKG